MSWDNNSGGGGRGGGPWGQGPSGPGPRRPGPGGTPSLEELLNRGREQFRGNLPGGSRLFFVGIILAIVALWLTQSVYQVAPNEVGVELRFGKPKEQLSEPGLHFLLWPIERVERVSLVRNQSLVGSTGSARASNSNGFMLSGDQNIIDVSFSVFWQVNNPQDYLFNVRDPDDMVRRAGESAMREVVGRSLASDVFRDKRTVVELEVLGITQDILNDYGAGISISEIKMSNVAPPPDVADAFAEVQRAEQDGDRFQNEARQYANTLLGDARGQAARIRENATAYKDQIVKQAEGEAQRFLSLYEEYVKSPDVTRKRLYLETLENVLGGSQKVIVEQGAGGSNIVPYLPLPELRANSAAGAAPATTATGGQ